MALRGSDTFAGDWARTLTDPQAFAHEQRRLAFVWTFLGFTGDVAKEGDWFRASLSTRSVFVQRFGAELRGFENVCAHRFYPLRTEEKGNGPIVCGFHHWRYDRDGKALGIPECQQQFGTVSRALDAHLNQIEVATCGTLIFGRFPASEQRESLLEYLGLGFPILEALSRPEHKPLAFSRPIKANWKLALHISLDDYHPVAIHPRTFGRRGYVNREDISYSRFGAHSAFLDTKRAEALEEMAVACADGSFQANCYSIFQILPNFLIAMFQSHGNFFHCCIQHFIPVSNDETILRSWVYPAPFAVNAPWLVRSTRWLSDMVRGRLVMHYARQVMREDNQVCERLQEVAHQVGRPPYLAALEERIGWFEQSYQELVAGSEECEAGWTRPERF